MSHLTSVEIDFLNLRSQGYSYDKISKDLRVSKHTLIKWAKELQPKIDTQFRAAFKKYQTALVQRVEFLSQQFQTMTQLITTCDPKSSAFPRYFNILLKLHKSLEPFDVAPEPDSTISAPESSLSTQCEASRRENPKSEIQNSSPPLTARLAGSSDAEDTKTAPSSNSEPGPLNLESSIPPNPLRAYPREYMLKNSLLPPPEQELKKLHKLLKRLDRAEAKLAS